MIFRLFPFTPFYIYIFIVTYDFTDLLNNVDLNDLCNIINDLFQKYFTNLNLQKTLVILKLTTYFIINNNFTMHNPKIYLHVAGVAQDGCLSSMLANLFLYYYGCSYIKKSLHYVDILMTQF